jgi:hypothetical protein
LESYHPYLLPQEVSKTPITLGTYGSLPKIRKGRFGSLSPLGVNFANTQTYETIGFLLISIGKKLGSVHSHSTYCYSCGACSGTLFISIASLSCANRQEV